MLSNDNQRLNLWLESVDKFSYKEHQQQCSYAGCDALPYLEFAQKVGMLMCASKEYPDMTLDAAYLLFIASNTVEIVQPVQTEVTTPMPEYKPCCGGGTVL